MRALEILIPILLAAAMLWPRPRPLAVKMLPLATLFLVVLHLLVEGYRWEMIPLYGLVVVLAVLAVASLLRKKDFGWAVSAPFMALVALACVLPVLVPVPSVPSPRGPYAVGTLSQELRDDTRQEIWSNKDEARRLMIRVWYPAQPVTGDKLAPWMERAEVYAPALAAYMNLPSFALDHLALAKTPAFANAKLAPKAGGYPMVLFSHGWKGFLAQNTAQALELASLGYVVVAVEHAYGAIVSVYPDGSVAPNNPAALPDGAPDDVYEASARRLVEQWSGDLTFVLDSVLAENTTTTSPLYGAFDASRIGVYGHSTGAGAALQFAARDARVRSVLGMDPFMRPVSPAVIEAGLAKPSFFLFSQRWNDDTASLNNKLFAALKVNTTQSLGQVAITGTAHLDFSDLPMLSPLAPVIGLKGPIEGGRITTLLNDYLQAFFGQTLRDQPSALWAGTSPYPEVVAKD